MRGCRVPRSAGLAFHGGSLPNNRSRSSATDLPISIYHEFLFSSRYGENSDSTPIVYENFSPLTREHQRVDHRVSGTDSPPSRPVAWPHPRRVRAPLPAQAPPVGVDVPLLALSDQRQLRQLRDRLAPMLSRCMAQYTSLQRTSPSISFPGGRGCPVVGAVRPTPASPMSGQARPIRVSATPCEQAQNFHFPIALLSRGGIPVPAPCLRDS